VTRPTASATGVRTASTRAGQPAPAHAARQASSASAVGTSDTNGESATTRERYAVPARRLSFRVHPTPTLGNAPWRLGLARPTLVGTPRVGGGVRATARDQGVSRAVPDQCCPEGLVASRA
jgi:hypothetical protein